MAVNTQIKIHIDGKEIPAFKSLELIQEIDDHHSIEIVCRKDTIETMTSGLVGESKDFLGESILLEIKSEDGFSDDELLQFKGVVTSVKIIKGFYHKSGDLVKIIGKSCSIIADDGPNYASHLERSLSEIIEKTFSGYNASLLKVKVAPDSQGTVHYSVQHEESAFQYASRLAAQYGEWFYYDGSTLVFGKPQSKDVTKLVYGYDVLELSVDLEPQPNSFNYITNDYYNATHHEARTKEIATGVNGENGFVSKKSEKLYPKETQVFVSAHDDISMKPRMDQQIRKQKLAKEANQVRLSGISSNPKVQIGQVITIDDESSSFGNYRITKVRHTCTENGQYENTFEARTASVDVFPKTSVAAFPKSPSQTAVVVDNVDPEGLGRVKVQYAWQKQSGETSPWTRLSSTAGGSGQGFFFVPEKGDEVIVGHEGGNAEAPIIQGSLYNSSSVPESFKSGNNHLKAIKTRSGNQVTLNDADGSVTIADPSGNTIVMGGNGEITISAPNKITFDSKDIVVNASNDYTLTAGNNIAATASSNISANASKAMSLDAGDSLKASSKATSVKGSKSVSIFGKRVAITGSVMTNIQSGTVLTVITAGVLNLTGAATSLINGAKVKILGGKVDIN